MNDILTDELDNKFAAIQQAKEEEYPVGRVVEFYDDLDHSGYLGFNWERCHIGKVPVGLSVTENEFNTIGKTGGEKKHTLTVAEMPSHFHDLGFHAVSEPNVQSGTGIPFHGNGNAMIGDDGRGCRRAGGSQSHNILQPYEVVSFWKRVS